MLIRLFHTQKQNALVEKWKAVIRSLGLDLAMMDAGTYLIEWPILDYGIWNKITPRNFTHDAEVCTLGAGGFYLRSES